MDYIRFNAILLVKSGKSQDAARRLNEISKKSNASSAGNIRSVALIMEELGADDKRFFKAP